MREPTKQESISWQIQTAHFDYFETISDETVMEVTYVVVYRLPIGNIVDAEAVKDYVKHFRLEMPIANEKSDMDGINDHTKYFRSLSSYDADYLLNCRQALLGLCFNRFKLLMLKKQLTQAKRKARHATRKLRLLKHYESAEKH